MNSFRVARAALRVRPTAFAAPLARRGYADVASDKIQLSLSLPHQAIYKSQDVVQVNIPAETGDMGVLASHVPSIEQLRPGLVEVIEESAGSKQFFLSGGFATVQPGSKLSINAVEGFPLEDFSAEAVRNQIAEAQKIASGSGSEQDIAEAKIELEPDSFFIVSLAPTQHQWSMQRLGWQHSSSSSSSNPWLSPPNLDGRQSQPQRRLPFQPPSTKAIFTHQRRPNAPDVVPCLRQSGRVADRIRAINSLQQLPSKVPKKFTEPVPPLKLPIVLFQEDDLRRASPFPRRDSAQSPIRPQTPLSQSRPAGSPLVHCPMPKRYQPQLSANIEREAMPIDSQPMCYRHGRKLKLRKTVPAGMDRAFNGAYVPTGPQIRQQVDPLSPWAVGTRLAKTLQTAVSPDICPDCLAEQRIMERETGTYERTSRVQADQPVKSTSSSVFTERGTPPEPDQPSNVLVGTTIDSQTVKVPGAAVSGLPPDKFGSIVATDLGDMIDAIIVEHSGSLGKVISNIRNGMPDSDWTQKLSRDLTKVSEAVASLPEDNIRHAPAFSRNISGRHSIILDASPDSLCKRAKAMPELLDLVDAATEEFSFTGSTRRDRTFNVDRPLVPGEFPKSPSTLPSTNADPAIVTPAMPPFPYT
ncbi:hypothetical protein QM012_002845 [Aureobasidium pullulans]|uniref:ATP synthase subunit delta, mitochondrial n=2 Tax=Aureobasidium TaxID=5579 RepID=A0ABR0TAT8_AURPU